MDEYTFDERDHELVELLAGKFLLRAAGDRDEALRLLERLAPHLIEWIAAELRQVGEF